MNIANGELSEELFKLSGWKETEFNWWLLSGGPETKFEQKPVAQHGLPRVHNGMKTIPAYDLGYLIRKLGDGTDIIYFHDETDAASYSGVRVKADTPENATAKLCIELFKQGILKKEGKGNEKQSNQN